MSPSSSQVRTQDFHSCNRGSNPLGDAILKCKKEFLDKEFFFVMNNYLKATILMAIGSMLVFPFLTPFIMRVVVVVFGFYLFFMGLKVLVS